MGVMLWALSRGKSINIFSLLFMVILPEGHTPASCHGSTHNPHALTTINATVSNEFEVFIKLILLILSAPCALGIHCQPICWCKKGITQLFDAPLSLSCHSPNITSPQSDLTTVVSSPGQNGLICAEKEKERNRREARRERIESPAEKKGMGFRGRRGTKGGSE